MERLPSQWITLHNLETSDPHVLDEHSQKIDIVLRRVLALLKDKGFVHGDFRPNNIMIDRDTLENEGVAEVKIVNFDWSGKANKALYPLSRDRTIFWPAGLPGGPVEQEDDTMLFQSWWHHTF
jgi:serine/threonine protein kinase